MNEIVAVLYRPEWWFSVVLAGIFINLLSSFLFRRFDSALARISGWWRTRSERRKALWEQKVSRIATDADAREMAFQGEIRQRMAAQRWLTLSVLFMGLIIVSLHLGLSFPRWSMTMLWVPTCLLYFISFLEMVMANTEERAINEANSRRAAASRESA